MDPDEIDVQIVNLAGDWLGGRVTDVVAYTRELDQLQNLRRQVVTYANPVLPPPIQANDAEVPRAPPVIPRVATRDETPSDYPNFRSGMKKVLDSLSK